MYSDEDGTASKESEIVYWSRVRNILTLNSLLSLVGCILTALTGEDRGESIARRSLKPWPAGSVAGCAAGEHQTDGRSSSKSDVSEMEQ